jgi:hypothetical protein
MGPHADDFDDPLRFQDFVNQAVLNIDAAGISARQVTHNFSNRGEGRKGSSWTISNSSMALPLRPAAANFLASF